MLFGSLMWLSCFIRHASFLDFKVKLFQDKIFDVFYHIYKDKHKNNISDNEA